MVIRLCSYLKAYADNPCRLQTSGLPSACSQGGVEFPTGGKGFAPQARERPRNAGGQQIWCNSRADGQSPDGRERREGAG
jgi:hypothetical protein